MRPAVPVDDALLFDIVNMGIVRSLARRAERRVGLKIEAMRSWSFQNDASIPFRPGASRGEDLCRGVGIDDENDQVS